MGIKKINQITKGRKVSRALNLVTLKSVQQKGSAPPVTALSPRPDALLRVYDIRSRAFRINTYLRPAAIKSRSDRATIGAVQVILFVCLKTYNSTDISSPDESPTAANYHNNILHLGRQRYTPRPSLTNHIF